MVIICNCKHCIRTSGSGTEIIIGKRVADIDVDGVSLRDLAVNLHDLNILDGVIHIPKKKKKKGFSIGFLAGVPGRVRVSGMALPQATLGLAIGSQLNLKSKSNRGPPPRSQCPCRWLLHRGCTSAREDAVPAFLRSCGSGPGYLVLVLWFLWTTQSGNWCLVLSRPCPVRFPS